MLKKQLNHARLGIVLRPRGPVLIKSGFDSPDPTRPSMEFVRTRHPRWGDTVYLPGTSLKGAIRSHAERVLRGHGMTICDLFKKNDPTCEPPSDAKTNGRLNEPAIFRKQCPACRTFGSLNLNGRANILDAYPWPTDATEEEQREAFGSANTTETRWQVGINRKSGQAQGGALFDLETVVQGEFHTEIHLCNFQLWQLGLVAAVLRDVDEGLVPIGFGKSRGLGQVAFKGTYLHLETVDRETGRIAGTAALSDEDECRSYGLFDSDTLSLPAGLTSSKSWRGTRLEVESERLTELLIEVVHGPFVRYLEAGGRRPPTGGG